MRRRTFLAAGLAGAATLAAPTLAADAAIAGTYGSGTLGTWTDKARRISTATTCRNAVSKGGVFMFGDSIAVQDGKHLAEQLYARDGSVLAVHNWAGRPTGPAVDALEQWASAYGLPDRILMATGSNDIFAPPGFRAQVDWAIRIADGRTLVWVDVHVSRWSQPAAVQVADQRNSGWVNSQLGEAAADWSNLRIVRWAERLAGKPGYRIPAYLSDGVHTSVPLGRAARNAMIVEALT